jgi:hypothetical protein
MNSKKISNFIRNTDIQLLISIPIILTLLIIIGAAIISNHVFQGNTPEKVTGMIISSGLFVSGFSGLLQVYRKESPSVMGRSLHGKIPIIMGLFWLMFSWGLSVLLLISVITSKK